MDFQLLCAGTSPLQVAGTTNIDTDDGTIDGAPAAAFTALEQEEGTPEIGVFSFDSINLSPSSLLRVRGERAVALLACRTAIIAGTIDVSALGTDEPHQIDIGGPGGYMGGSPGAVGFGPGAGGIGEGAPHSSIHSTGSGGGGNGGGGGEGGPHRYYTPGEGGRASGTAEIVPLVGGSGGAGQVVIYDWGDDWAPGTGGGGGGAIQISAGDSITVQSTGGIRAAGGGGGRTINGGGAGGGAGGSILLEAQSVIVESGAFLAANGGGGSAGDCT